MSYIKITNSSGRTVRYQYIPEGGSTWIDGSDLGNGGIRTFYAEPGSENVYVYNASDLIFTDNVNHSTWYGANDPTIATTRDRDITLTSGSPPAPIYRTLYSYSADGSIAHGRIRHMRGTTLIGTYNLSGTVQVSIGSCTDGDTLIFDEITFVNYTTGRPGYEFPIDVYLNDGTHIGRYSSSFTLSVDSRYTNGVRILLSSTRIYWKGLLVSLDRYDSEGKPGFNSATVDGGREISYVVKDALNQVYVTTNTATRFRDIVRSLSNHRSAYPYSIEIRNDPNGSPVATLDFQRGETPSFFAGDYASEPLYVNLKPAKINRGLFSWFGARDKEIIPKIGDPKSFTFYMKAEIWNSFVYAVLDLFECYNETFSEYTEYLVSSGDEFIHTIFNGVKNKLRDMTLGKPGVLPSNVGPGSRVLPGYFHGAGSLKNGLNVGIQTYLNTAEDP